MEPLTNLLVERLVLTTKVGNHGLRITPLPTWDGTYSSSSSNGPASARSSSCSSANRRRPSDTQGGWFGERNTEKVLCPPSSGHMCSVTSIHRVATAP